MIDRTGTEWADKRQSGPGDCKRNQIIANSDHVPKLLKIKPVELNRPNFPSIVQRMVDDGLDVEVSSKTHVISLWRAISRAGFWSWSFRVGEAAWRVRLSKTPIDGTINPLIEECKRTFKTQYCQWRKYIPDLIDGKAIMMPTMDEATRFSRSARYHLKKEELPPFKVIITPNEGKFDVNLILK